jgi:chromosome segregation ATPase
MPSQGTIETHTKSIRFHPYKSTRPDLLYKIKGILAVGSRDLGKKYADQDVPEQEWVNLYSTAFEEYIQASTMYQTFLRETKTHYDKRVEELADKVLSYKDFDETLERKEKEHESTLQRSLLESKQRIRELEKSSANLNNNFGSMYSELQTTTEENKLLVDRVDSLKREVTSCKLTIQSLTQSLQRVDEEKSKAELKESALTLELNDYRRHELTMAAENYELQKSIEEKNRIHGTLLHPSVLEAKHRENEALKEEHQRLLHIHRQLLVRFAALKYTIDGSITRIMTTRHEDEQEGVPSSERFHLESLVDKLLSEYRDVLRRESIKLLVDRKTPMEKLSELVTSTRFPQVLFESLMDHLELMMVEKTKILSDEAIQIGTHCIYIYVFYM